jgi:hypothetical protein
VAGEVPGVGMVGRLGERTSILRPPGARCRIGSQNMVDCGQEEEYKRASVLGKTRAWLGEASGEVAQANELV